MSDTCHKELHRDNFAVIRGYMSDIRINCEVTTSSNQNMSYCSDFSAMSTRCRYGITSEDLL